jgi:hypothetical protein
VWLIFPSLSDRAFHTQRPTAPPHRVTLTSSNAL